MGGQFFPRKKPRDGTPPKEAPVPPNPPPYSSERCHPNVPTAQCEGRRKARASGDMLYDFELDAWVLFNDLAYTRTISGNGGIDRWKKVQSAGRDTTGESYLLEICPFCGCDLPNLNPPKLHGPIQKPLPQSDGNSD